MSNVAFLPVTLHALRNFRPEEGEERTMNVRSAFEAIGIKFGGMASDPNYTVVELPEGWERKDGPDNYSSIIDERGFDRVTIFLNTGDLAPSASMVAVGSKIVLDTVYGQRPMPMPWDQLDDLEVKQALFALGQMRGRIMESPDVYGHHEDAVSAIEQTIPKAWKETI